MESTLYTLPLLSICPALHIGEVEEGVGGGVLFALCIIWSVVFL